MGKPVMQEEDSTEAALPVDPRIRSESAGIKRVISAGASVRFFGEMAAGAGAG
jgi:hypothetical protein